MKYFGAISDSKDIVNKGYVDGKIDALDATVTGSAGSGKTLTAFSQTDGKVSATFDNISITKSQVSDFPTIPTVNNATLTIQKNGSNVATFTANASSNATANITVPTSAADVSALPISGGTLSGGNQIFNCRIANSSSREASASPAATGKRGITSFLSSGTMTTDRPPSADGTGTAEGTIIHCEWDNTGGWNSQLFIGDNDTNNKKPFLSVRGQRSGTWTSWDNILAFSNRFMRSNAGTLEWTTTDEGHLQVITKSALAYWNGAYSGTSSSLKYSANGEIVGTSTGLGKTTWTPTSGSSYSNYGGCYYEKYGRVVHVHVGVSGLTSGTATDIYTLPSGYRPSSTIYAHGTGGAWNNIGYVEISTGGVITCRSQGAYCGADITFLA